MLQNQFVVSSIGVLVNVPITFNLLSVLNGYKIIRDVTLLFLLFLSLFAQHVSINKTGNFDHGSYPTPYINAEFRILPTSKPNSCNNTNMIQVEMMRNISGIHIWLICWHRNVQVLLLLWSPLGGIYNANRSRIGNDLKCRLCFTCASRKMFYR